MARLGSIFGGSIFLGAQFFGGPLFWGPNFWGEPIFWGPIFLEAQFSMFNFQCSVQIAEARAEHAGGLATRPRAERALGQFAPNIAIKISLKKTKKQKKEPT